MTCFSTYLNIGHSRTSLTSFTMRIWYGFYEYNIYPLHNFVFTENEADVFLMVAQKDYS